MKAYFQYLREQIVKAVDQVILRREVVIVFGVLEATIGILAEKAGFSSISLCYIYKCPSSLPW